MNLREVVTLAPLIVWYSGLASILLRSLTPWTSRSRSSSGRSNPTSMDVETLDARQAAPPLVPVAELADPAIAGELVDGENN